MQLFRRAVLAISFLTASVNAMKEGQPGPFSLGVTVFLNGQEFRAPASRFPAHNTMNAQGVYATLCSMAQGQLQAALNTGWANQIFTMDYCRQLFDQYIQAFSNFIFSQPENHSASYYQGEEYTFSNGHYFVTVLDSDPDPTHIKVLLGCREGD